MSNAAKHNILFVDDDADFRTYLEGSVAWVTQVQPARGAKLHALLRRIEWPVT